MSTLPLFGFVPAEDRDRLQTALQRVFWTLSHGQWTTALALQRVGGLSWSRRVRNLREDRYGALDVQTRKSDQPGVWEYRLDVESVPCWAWISYRSGVFPASPQRSTDVLRYRLKSAGSKLDDKTLELAVEIVESLARQSSHNGEDRQ